MKSYSTHFIVTNFEMGKILNHLSTALTYYYSLDDDVSISELSPLIDKIGDLFKEKYLFLPGD